jgi:hypothetical protein
MKTISFKIFIITIFTLVHFQLFGQDGQKIKRLSTPIEFDGQPFEAAWNGLDFFPMSMYKPSFGAAPSENSEVMITFDDQYLWVGARLYTKDASTIVATSKKRDEQSKNSDSFGIILDTYNDNENALAFIALPTGARIDYAVSNDASGSSSTSGSGAGGGQQSGQGGGSVNMSWNTFWDFQTSRDDKGWYVEMRIPFSSLRFQSVNDIVTMGLIINRTISHNNETDTYPSIDPKYGSYASMKPSLANTIEIDGAKPTKPIYFSPYGIGGFSRDWVPNSDVTQPYVKIDNPDYTAGLDVKYSLNSNLTLDLTVNTDFAQVEADNQQVNLTRYSLFFPEKRSFFQERSSLFSYSLGGSSNLFYSRNIGMANGTPIRIYGGARIVGRVGKWDMGLIDMQTEEHTTSPGENFGIFRMRRRVINPNSFVGGIFTSRLGMNGQQNFAYGVDGIFKLYGEDYLDIKLAETYDKTIDNRIASKDPLFFSANWERRSQKGFNYNLNYSYSGKQFDPGIGYVQKSSLQGIDAQLQYGWMPGEKSRYFSYGPEVQIQRFTRVEDGNLESLLINPGLRWNTKKGFIGQIGFNYQEEGVLRDFALSDSVRVRSGDYSFIGFEARIRTPTSRPVSANININAGEFYDGQKYTFSIIPAFNVSSSLQLSGSYSFNAVRFPDRSTNNKLDIHSANVTALFMLNTKLTASVLVQYVSTQDDLIANFRLRYNPREGNDFYLVYNEYRGIGSDNELLSLPTYYSRTIILKYTHTFIANF